MEDSAKRLSEIDLSFPKINITESINSNLATPSKEIPVYSRWREVIKHPAIVLVLGGRGSGKSAVAYRITEDYRYSLSPYVVGFPEHTKSLLPNWMGNIFLVSCSGLFFFGLTTDVLSSFVPAMVLGICSCLVWVGLAGVFARYTSQRFDSLQEISMQLGIPPMPVTPPRMWWFPFTQARTYAPLFALLYIAVWVLRLVLGFLI